MTKHRRFVLPPVLAICRACGFERLHYVLKAQTGLRTRSKCIECFAAEHAGRSHTWKVWSGMRQRAGKRHDYAHAPCCERWRKSFDAFVADMGEAPTDDHTLDRIDNAKGYQPDNCRWATWSEQNQNRSITKFLEWRGERRIAREWAEITGIKTVTIRARLRAGWSVDRALSTPTMVEFSNGGRWRQRAISSDEFGK